MVIYDGTWTGLELSCLVVNPVYYSWKMGSTNVELENNCLYLISLPPCKLGMLCWSLFILKYKVTLHTNFIFMEAETRRRFLRNSSLECCQKCHILKVESLIMIHTNNLWYPCAYFIVTCALDMGTEKFTQYVLYHLLFLNYIYYVL